MWYLSASRETVRVNTNSKKIERKTEYFSAPLFRVGVLLFFSRTIRLCERWNWNWIALEKHYLHALHNYIYTSTAITLLLSTVKLNVSPPRDQKTPHTHFLCGFSVCNSGEVELEWMAIDGIFYSVISSDLVEMVLMILLLLFFSLFHITMTQRHCHWLAVLSCNVGNVL